MTFILTPTIIILLTLFATQSAVVFLWSKLRGRLKAVQYITMNLILFTATLHMLSGANDYLLYLNGVGYLILLTLLYFAPLGPLESYRPWLYVTAAIYTLITIVGYFIFHPWAIHAGVLDWVGVAAKGSEAGVLITLAIDYLRGGQPVAPLMVDGQTESETQFVTSVPEGVPALMVQGLSYSYPDKPGVLQGINFTIQPHERIGLIGPNGAGKTTLFMSLVGIQRPEAGEITLFGRSMKHRDFRPEIGMVFQKSDDQLFSASVRDDVAFGPENLGLLPNEVEERVSEAMSLTGVMKLADRPPHHLSGGEKRMVSIAGVMAMQPQLVIYDEPSANLDIRSRRRLIEFLQKTDHAFLISSHDLEFLLEVCDRVLLLDHGQIIADGPPREVMSDTALMEAHGLECPHSLTPHNNLDFEDALV